jgi:hypothetical protein
MVTTRTVESAARSAIHEKSDKTKSMRKMSEVLPKRKYFFRGNIIKGKLSSETENLTLVNKKCEQNVNEV